MTARPWTPAALARLNDRFEEAPPERALGWAFGTFGDEAAMGTGFGPSGVVLMSMLARMRPGATVFYLDTGVLFAETHALRDRLAARLDLRFVRVDGERAEAEGDGQPLWQRDPDRCCRLRKVVPLRRYLSDKRAWATAIRRDQSGARAGTRVVEWNATHGVVKVNPLAAWTEADVWAFVRAHDLPYNPLHDRGYPSIGCRPCTAPVGDAAEDARAGRWAGRPKIECGLHLSP